MRKVEVNLQERSYVITIGAGAISDLGKTLLSCCKPTKVAVISNTTVARIYSDSVFQALKANGIEAKLVTMPPGERFKTLTSVRRIYASLIEMKMDRGGAIVALGGGVIGDMAGFAAATYMRGIDFIQVPTTVLAQVDASVGGKTGVDLPEGKNLIGAFHQPRSVIIDIDTLSTLPNRELKSGLAETIKHGIIYDQEYFNYVDANAGALLRRDQQRMVEAICRSVEIKRDVVENDERENGLRAILNYGHTVGHAVEALSGYGKLRHGEAVSIGMVTEAILAESIGAAQPGIAETIARTLKKFGLPVALSSSISTEEIIRFIELDKKTLGGKIKLALPVRIGECGIFADISRDKLADAINQHRVRNDW